MALTLLEASKKLPAGDVVRQAVIEVFAQETDILRVFPFNNIAGNALKYTQEETLPGIGFRGVNEGYTEGTGVLNPQTENLVIMGGDLDVDNFIIKTMGDDQRAAQESMKLKALSHTFSHNVIKGDSETTPKQFDGLQKRLGGNQVISNNTGANDPLHLPKLDELIDAVDNPTHLIMSKAMRRVLTQAARDTAVGGFITFEQDEFGRRQMVYDGLPIVIADGNGDLFATLAFDEAATNSGTAATSIYCVSFMEGMLHGIQNEVPDVRDLGEQDEKPVMRTRVEWYPGMVLMHPRAAARLRDIHTGAATKT
jgi:hypothetical protein